MEIKTIGYGRASVHDFESSGFREYCYMEATLDFGEDVDESIKLLRQVVCSKVGITEDLEKKEEQRDSCQRELTHLEERIAEARRKWEAIDKFMKKIDAAVEFDPIPF